MNAINDSELLGISGGNFAKDAGYFLGATASWLTAAAVAGSNPGPLTTKIVMAICL